MEPGIEAMNQSTLSLFVPPSTPAYAHEAMTHPGEITEALELGDAAWLRREMA